MPLVCSCVLLYILAFCSSSSSLQDLCFGDVVFSFKTRRRLSVTNLASYVALFCVSLIRCDITDCTVRQLTLFARLLLAIYCRLISQDANRYLSII